MMTVANSQIQEINVRTIALLAAFAESIGESFPAKLADLAIAWHSADVAENPQRTYVPTELEFCRGITSFGNPNLYDIQANASLLTEIAEILWKFNACPNLLGYILNSDSMFGLVNSVFLSSLRKRNSSAESNKRQHENAIDKGISGCVKSRSGNQQNLRNEIEFMHETAVSALFGAVDDITLIAPIAVRQIVVKRLHLELTENAYIVTDARTGGEFKIILNSGSNRGSQNILTLEKIVEANHDASPDELFFIVGQWNDRTERLQNVNYRPITKVILSTIVNSTLNFAQRERSQCNYHCELISESRMSRIIRRTEDTDVIELLEDAEELFNGLELAILEAERTLSHMLISDRLDYVNSTRMEKSEISERTYFRRLREMYRKGVAYSQE